MRMALFTSMATVPRSLPATRPAAVLPKPRISRIVRAAMPTASDVPVANDVFARPHAAAVKAVRKYLLSVGWDLAWIDGMTAEITKGNLKTSPEQCEAVIGYLESLGLPSRAVENMASISKPILGRSVGELTAVVEWLRGQGLDGKALSGLLMANPQLLSYAPAGDHMERGPARAALTFGERDGRRVVGVVQWRDGASFGSAPVSPQAPQRA